MPPIKPTAPMYPNINELDSGVAPPDDGMTFRLKQISEIRSFLEFEAETRSRLRRRYKSVYNTFFYASTASSITAVCAGAAGVTALGTGIGTPIALPLGIVSVATGALSAGTSAICKIILRKVEKHERVKNTAETKLSSINKMISKALQDNTISDEEFQLILQEKDSYRELKTQIRKRVRIKVKEMSEELKDQIEKKGVEKGKAEILTNLHHMTRQDQGAN